MRKILRTSLIYDISILLIVLSTIVGTANATTFTVDQSGSGTHTTINAALAASNNGDTINVNSGTYGESIYIDKQLIIKGVPNTGSGRPVINYVSTPVIIRASNVTFNGFVVTGSQGDGILVSSSNGNKLINNNVISAGGQGIFLDNANNNRLINNEVTSSGFEGIFLQYSNNNNLTNNTLELNHNFGIQVRYSENNILSSNRARHNHLGGILITLSASNTTIKNNIADNNDVVGIMMDLESGYSTLIGNTANSNPNGIGIYGSNNNNLTNNIANNNNGTGIQNSGSYNTLIGNTANGNVNGYGITVGPGSYNTLIGNTANNNNNGISVAISASNNNLTNNIANNNNKFGIGLDYCRYTTLIGNTVNGNDFGIGIYNSTNNNLKNNVVDNNSEIGISLDLSSNYNTVTDNTVRYNKNGLVMLDSVNNNVYNNYFNNTFIGSISNGNTNLLNIAKTGGTNIIGGPYLGGNFWGRLDGTGFSQTCYDDDKDGICDSSYNLSLQNTDYFPLAGNSTRPVAEAGGPYIVDEGTQVTFDSSGSYDPLGGVLTYAWDYNGDGIYEMKTPPFTRNARDGPSGSRTIGLEVKSDKGRVATDTAILTVNNVNPVVNAGQDQTINVGDIANFAASFSDVQPDMNESTAQVNYGDGTTENVVANPNGTINVSHSYTNSGTYTVTVTVTDKDGGIGSDALIVTVVSSNTPPIAEAGGPYTVNEGSPVTVDGSASSDPDGDALAHAWDLNNDSVYETPGVTATIVPSDGPAVLTVGLQVSDGKGGNGTDTATITVNNVAPVIDSLLADPYLAQVGTVITGTGTFHDPGTIDTFAAVWNWDDVTNTINLPAGSVSTTDSHTYTIPGVYSTSLQVTDKDGGSDIENMSQYIVIYDPDGGFVTGGGWINSPEGAYVENPTLIGKANFGFVSKYQQGATVPTGETEFQFKVADLNFHSTSYDWLVVAGARAQYKGSGTINGAGDYAFMLTAIDGQINGGGGADKFRIKIWEKATETIVYDNQNGATDDADPATAIAGGSIVIHK